MPVKINLPISNSANFISLFLRFLDSKSNLTVVDCFRIKPKIIDPSLV